MTKRLAGYDRVRPIFIAGHLAALAAHHWDWRGGVYLAERGKTAISEIAYHGKQAAYVLRYRLDLGRARTLDLTKPRIASEYGYIGGNASSYTQGVAERAIRRGFNVIKYPSLRGPGNNYVVLDDFDQLLLLMNVTPVAK